MISRLSGHLGDVERDAIVLDVNGIGFQIFVPQRFLANLPAIGGRVALFTHLIHREDAMLLFGFAHREERELFLLLNGVSGIGAKTAMGILSVLDVGQIVGAVLAQSPRTLAVAPGVGKKTAERIVLELRDKLAKWSPHDAQVDSADGSCVMNVSDDDPYAEVELALGALGYGLQEIAQAKARLSPGLNVETAIRQCLMSLSQNDSRSSARFS